jgi:hypothetical protein
LRGDAQWWLDGHTSTTTSLNIEIRKCSAADFAVFPAD